MHAVTIDEARNQLAELVAEAISGKDVIIRNGATAGVKLMPVPMPAVSGSSNHNPYPLRGTPIRYDRPCDPVAEEDWEALR